MAKRSQAHAGSLQYWPRKRAEHFLHSVNWQAVQKTDSEKKLLGFIVYKVGMATAVAKDNTPDSMTKDKRIAVPVTILEAPPVKILSVRFYKYNQVIGESFAENLDKELKRVIKMPKKSSKKIEEFNDYDDIKVLVYSLAKQTGIKKTPDISEIGLGGTKEEKLAFVKENMNKELRISDIFKPMQLVDARGLTIGKGLVGPMKRFGIGKKSHKSEKGVRRPGSLSPWHPAYVTFRTPMAGQLGLFSRIAYNLKVMSMGKIQEKNINPASGFHKFGTIRSDYIIVRGSVQGPQKRQILLTAPLRKTKKQEKKNLEFIKLVQ